MKHLNNLVEPIVETGTASWRVLKGVYADEPKRLILVLIAILLVGSMPYAVQAANGLMLNHLVASQGTGAIAPYLALLLVLLLGSSYLRDIARLVEMFISEILEVKMRVRYDTRLSQRLATLDPGTHEDPAFKDRMQLLQEYNGGFAVARYSDAIMGSLMSLTGFLTAAAIVLMFDWRLFALVFVCSIPHLRSELVHGKSMWTVMADHSADRRMYMELRRHTQNARGIRELQSFQNVSHFVNLQRQHLERFFGAELTVEKSRFKSQAFAETVMFVGIAVAMLILVLRVVDGDMQIGTFVFISGAVLALEGAASSFLSSAADQRAQARPVMAYYEILETEPRIKSPKMAVELAGHRAPHIEFRDVSFAYPSTPGQFALRNFSLTIEPGERVALVGINGAGKSTLIRLLCRYYDPTEGAILLNGIDLREYDLESWYRHLAVLGQDFETYKMRVKDVIELGRLERLLETDDAIERAATRAEASTFIEQLPDGFNQQIGADFAGGKELSGGQGQKLALARALYRDALVTVLDEPTAHVDAEAEERIFTSLETELSSEQSLLLISHRFSTVRTADKICVLGDGRTLELGSHEELMEKNGIYAALFRKQAKGYQ